MEVLKDARAEHGVVLCSHVMLQDRIQVEEIELGREERPVAGDEKAQRVSSVAVQTARNATGISGEDGKGGGN